MAFLPKAAVPFSASYPVKEGCLNSINQRKANWWLSFLPKRQWNIFPSFVLLFQIENSFRFPKHWFLFPFNTFFKTDFALPLTVKNNTEIQTVLSTCQNPEKEVFRVVRSWRLWRLKLSLWIQSLQQQEPTSSSFFPHRPHTAIPPSL